MPIDRFPPKMRPFLCSLRDWLLTDTVPLLVMGVTSICVGIAYVYRTHTPPYHPIEAFVSPEVMAWVWIGVGVILLLSVIFPRSKLAGLAFGLGVAIFMFWAGSLFMQFLFDPRSNGLARASLYFAIPLLSMYSLWLKASFVEKEKELLPTAEEVEDVIRRT